METVKKELADAKQIRKNRQEYDALAKLIKVSSAFFCVFVKMLSSASYR